MSATSVWDQMPSTGTNTLDCCRLEAAGFHKDVLQRLMTIKPCQNVVKHIICIESTKKPENFIKKVSRWHPSCRPPELLSFRQVFDFDLWSWTHGPFWWLASSKLKYKSLSQAASFRRCFLERWANEVRQHGTVHFRTRDSARPCTDGVTPLRLRTEGLPVERLRKCGTLSCEASFVRKAGRMRRKHRLLQKKWILSTLVTELQCERINALWKTARGMDSEEFPPHKFTMHSLGKFLKGSRMQTSSTNYMRCHWDGQAHQAFGWRWEILNERERKAPRRHIHKRVLYEKFGGIFWETAQLQSLQHAGRVRLVSMKLWKSICLRPAFLDANKHVWCLELKVCLLEVHVIIKSSSKITRLLRQVSESWPVWDGSSEVEFALGSWDAACTPAYYTAIRFS